jgi:hypothetical protein
VSNGIKASDVAVGDTVVSPFSSQRVLRVEQVGEGLYGMVELTTRDNDGQVVLTLDPDELVATRAS